MPGFQVNIGLLTLQPHRQLLASGTPVPLGHKALELLSILAEAQGDLLTKDEIMEALWPGMIVEDNTLHVHMMAVRRALGGEAARLVTVRSIGYRLDVDRAPHLETGAAAPAESVGVLPFANHTGDVSYDWLGDSIAEELIGCLSHYPGLKVSARSSSFASGAQFEDARRIAEHLRVGAIVEGSIRKGGDTIRIMAALVDARTGFHLWSDNFDHALGNVLQLEEDVASRIAAIVATRLRSG